MRWKNLEVRYCQNYVDLSCMMIGIERDVEERFGGRYVPFLHPRVASCSGGDLVLHGCLFSTDRTNQIQ